MNADGRRLFGGFPASRFGRTVKLHLYVVDGACQRFPSEYSESVQSVVRACVTR